MKGNKGLCFTCARYNPKAVGNCILAKDWMYLSKKHKYTLAVVDCEYFISVAAAFPEAPKTGNKKIDLDEGLV